MTSTTPKQDKLTLTTPFGECTISDKRSWNTPKVGDPEGGYVPVARVFFQNLTVNRKEYGGRSLEIKRHPRTGTSLDYHWFDGISDSAGRKLTEYFTTLPEVEPYLKDLDDADCREDEKSELTGELRMCLSKLTPSRHLVAGNARAKRRVDLLDEILVEFVRARLDNVWFDNIGKED